MEIREQFIRSALSSCRHFNGVQNKTCNAGVRYIGWKKGVEERAMPCIPDENSAVTVIQGLAAQIAVLSQQVNDPATVTALQNLATQLNASATSLGAAIVANTPAAPSAASKPTA